jgi:hypothetical protein
MTKKKGVHLFSSCSIKPSAHIFGLPATITYLPNELEQRLKAAAAAVYLSKEPLGIVQYFKNSSLRRKVRKL